MTVKPRINHLTAIAEDDIYYGWPANHGAWQRKDELLVGIALGKHDPSAYSMHKVGPIVKGLLRSKDGGTTWEPESPYDFVGHGASTKPTIFTPGLEIYRVCGHYDHGGEGCDKYGSIYASRDFGKRWYGPFIMQGLDWLYKYGDWRCTARTCVLGDLIFLSAAASGKFGTDFVICARISDHGFDLLSVIKPSDGTRCVCPSAVSDYAGNIYVACRRRDMRNTNNWVDLYKSADGGLTWQYVSIVGVTGDPNGNPPALKALRDERLACAYGNRTTGQMILSLSRDKGVTWDHVEIRSNPGMFDFGYPQLFEVTDGTLVCVYYWTKDLDSPASIEVSHIRF